MFYMILMFWLGVILFFLNYFYFGIRTELSFITLYTKEIAEEFKRYNDFLEKDKKKRDNQ